MVHRKKFRSILQRYPILYDVTLGEAVETDHVIDLKDGSIPRSQLPYHTGPSSLDFFKYHAGNILNIGLIELETTPWASPVVLAPTKCSYQFFIDYYQLNDIKVRGSYPLPSIDECIDRFVNSKFMSNLYCNLCYFKIKLKDSDRYKAIFFFHSVSYRSN